MKILLVFDGSSYSDIATKTLEALKLPTKTEVTVMTVIPEHTFLGGITLDKIRGTTLAKKKAQQEKTAKLLSGPVQLLSASGLKAESLVRWGNPAQEISRVADESGASLIVMGAKGLTDSSVFRLGSVAFKVMKYASCSVLLARRKATRIDQGLPTKEKTAINRVLLATDGSKYSDMAAQFLLNLPLPRQSQVKIITALQSHAVTLVKNPTLELKNNRELLTTLREKEEKEALSIVARDEERFKTKGYKTTSSVVKGAAGESILKAAEKYNPDLITLGSRGLTGIESLLLGSVAETIARYAPCSVLIGRGSK